MTNERIAEARTYLKESSARVKAKGGNLPTSGAQFERATLIAARSFEQLHKAARLARKAQSRSKS